MSMTDAINLPFNFSSIRDQFALNHSPATAGRDIGHWAILQGNSVVLAPRNGELLLPHGTLPTWVEPKNEPLLIGTWQGEPLQALAIGGRDAIPEPFRPEAFNAADNRLDIRTLTLAGLGRQILHWNRESGYCSRCGTSTVYLADSWGRRCTGCAAEHFPHIHPCAIVLVKRDREVLLTRKAEWAPGRYSLVAGFLDFGECLEECASREVREETGIEIRNVRYVGSQNWPFPSQLMAGFVADYAGGEIQVDRSELEDAAWFSIDALPSLPPTRSIARHIIDTYAR